MTDSTRLLPEAADVAERQPLAELAFLADDAAEAGQLLGHPLVQLDDLVERVGDLAGDAGPLGRQADAGAPLPEGGQPAEQGHHFDPVGRERFERTHGQTPGKTALWTAKETENRTFSGSWQGRLPMLDPRDMGSWHTRAKPIPCVRRNDRPLPKFRG